MAGQGIEAQPPVDPKRSRVMRAVKSENTKPELYVRHALFQAGFRYRLHASGLPGKPDLVLPKYKTVVFVNGCFWHWHGCKRSRMPATNRDYWTRKIDRNVARDRQAQQDLNALGWRYVVIWECSLKQETEALVRALEQERAQASS